MYYFRISGQLIHSSEIEYISDIKKLTTPNFKAFYFTLKLQNGKIIKYYKKYDESNQLLHHLKVVQLQIEITSTMKITANNMIARKVLRQGEENKHISQNSNTSSHYSFSMK